MKLSVSGCMMNTLQPTSAASTVGTEMIDTVLLDQFQTQDQMEQQLLHREKYTHLDCQLQNLRSNYTKLQYAYMFLKLEYEHEQRQHARVIEEMKIRHEAQVSGRWSLLLAFYSFYWINVPSFNMDTYFLSWYMQFEHQ